MHQCIYTIDLVSGSAGCALHGVTLRMFTFQRRDVVHVGFVHCRYICMNHSLIGPSLSEYLLCLQTLLFTYLLTLKKLK